MISLNVLSTINFKGSWYVNSKSNYTKNYIQRFKKVFFTISTFLLLQIWNGVCKRGDVCIEDKKDDVVYIPRGNNYIIHLLV